MSDIFDGGGVGATAPSEQFGGLLSQPPLSPAVERPAPLPTASEPEPEPAPAAAPAPAEPVAAEPDPNAPGMLERKLLQFGLVTMDQLGEAMREEAATGRPVAGILIDRGWVSQEQITQLFEPVAPLARGARRRPGPGRRRGGPARADARALVPRRDPGRPRSRPRARACPGRAAGARAGRRGRPSGARPRRAAHDPAPHAKAPSPSSLAFHLYIRLSTGERIDANVFDDLNDARAHAEDLVKKLSSNSHVWPHFGGRYIRPEAIISIDVEAAPV